MTPEQRDLFRAERFEALHDDPDLLHAVARRVQGIVRRHPDWSGIGPVTRIGLDVAVQLDVEGEPAEGDDTCLRLGRSLDLHHRWPAFPGRAAGV